MHNVVRLHTLLEHAAEQHPEHTSIIFDEQSITYKALDVAADRISEMLQTAGIGPGARIALCCPKSIATVASLFGILKAGAAYLPVDFFSPAERNQFIVKNAEAAAVIADKSIQHLFEADFDLAGTVSDTLILLKSKSGEHAPSPDGLAYILYTSGSTGVPKGVMHSHEAALEFVNWSSNVFKPKTSDRFSSHAPFHFDLSVFDLFVAVKHAASIVLIPEEVAKQPLLLAPLIGQSGVTVLYCTPSVLTLLSEYGKMERYSFEKLRLVLFAGEVFAISKFKALREKVPQAVYYNLYGPTETNVCTYFHVPEKIDVTIPIGNVCEHYRMLIRDEELYIAGKGLMLGYWKGDPEKAFWRDEQGLHWYNTGDLVSTDEAGNLIFKGRRDRMVKRNGYRIELDEIETALDKHPHIAESAVIAYRDEEEQLNIAAFVVVTNEDEKSVLRMKEYCMKSLPSYMVPNRFVFAERLPYTSSHKTDYQELKKAL